MIGRPSRSAMLRVRSPERGLEVELAAHRIVRERALAALDRGVPFRPALVADARVTAVLPPVRLARCFDLERAPRGVDELFARAAEPGP